MATSIERASAVAKYVELLSVSLSAATLATRLLPLHLPESLAIQSRYRARHEFSAESRRLQVSVDFEFDGRIPNDEGQEPAVKLNATLSIVYALKEGAEYPEGALDDFAQLNGAYNAWPYWRELVQSVSGRVGLAGIIIPVFRAGDFETRFARIEKNEELKPGAAAQPS